MLEVGANATKVVAASEAAVGMPFAGEAGLEAEAAAVVEAEAVKIVTEGTLVVVAAAAAEAAAAASAAAVGAGVEEGTLVRGVELDAAGQFHQSQCPNETRTMADLAPARQPRLELRRLRMTARKKRSPSGMTTEATQRLRQERFLIG